MEQKNDTINNADIRPSRFDMLKRNNRNNFNQFQEFIQERELDDKIIQIQKKNKKPVQGQQLQTDSKQKSNLKRQFKTLSRIRHSQSVDKLN